MKNKKLTYFIFTYSIFGVYLAFAILSYNKILSSINTRFFVSDTLKLIAAKYFVISMIGLGLVGLLKKRHIWEFPVMIVSNLIDIYGVSGMTSVRSTVKAGRSI